VSGLWRLESSDRDSLLRPMSCKNHNAEKMNASTVPDVLSSYLSCRRMRSLTKPLGLRFVTLSRPCLREFPTTRVTERETPFSLGIALEGVMSEEGDVDGSVDVLCNYRHNQQSHV
jgi:hypothetical protein